MPWPTTVVRHYIRERATLFRALAIQHTGVNNIHRAIKIVFFYSKTEECRKTEREGEGIAAFC